ncbi:MAG TPA: ribonuclease PH [candidate division Zixibacteria bacterium]|nr:ribonuclease PH [candidate division Zixibacteria bacterium]
MDRIDGRLRDQLRPLTFQKDFSLYAEGSVLTKFGNTHVLCNVTLDDSLPNWLRRSPETHGWLTAEYALLPRSTQRRVHRESRWPKGRTQEISRLIGRSLRMAVDLELLGQRQLIVDCDVLQADGGTRTAAISGAWIAVNLALRPLIDEGILNPEVLSRQIAAISVGVVKGIPILDLAYDEDISADVDLNIVTSSSGEIIEIQGTAEKSPLDRRVLDELLDLASIGINQICQSQMEALSSISPASS